MMGERQVRQEALFYGFSLEEHVPTDHQLRSIDRFVVALSRFHGQCCTAEAAAWNAATFCSGVR